MDRPHPNALVALRASLAACMKASRGGRDALETPAQRAGCPARALLDAASAWPCASSEALVREVALWLYGPDDPLPRALGWGDGAAWEEADLGLPRRFRRHASESYLVPTEASPDTESWFALARWRAVVLAQWADSRGAALGRPTGVEGEAYDDPAAVGPLERLEGLALDALGDRVGELPDLLRLAWGASALQAQRLGVAGRLVRGPADAVALLAQWAPASPLSGHRSMVREPPAELAAQARDEGPLSDAVPALALAWVCPDRHHPRTLALLADRGVRFLARERTRQWAHWVAWAPHPDTLAALLPGNDPLDPALPWADRFAAFVSLGPARMSWNVPRAAWVLAYVRERWRAWPEDERRWALDAWRLQALTQMDHEGGWLSRQALAEAGDPDDDARVREWAQGGAGPADCLPRWPLNSSRSLPLHEGLARVVLGQPPLPLNLSLQRLMAQSRREHGGDTVGTDALWLAISMAEPLVLEQFKPLDAAAGEGLIAALALLARQGLPVAGTAMGRAVAAVMERAWPAQAPLTDAWVAHYLQPRFFLLAAIAAATGTGPAPGLARWWLQQPLREDPGGAGEEARALLALFDRFSIEPSSPCRAPLRDRLEALWRRVPGDGDGAPPGADGAWPTLILAHPDLLAAWRRSRLEGGLDGAVDGGRRARL